MTTRSRATLARSKAPHGPVRLDPSWASLYRIGAFSALLYVVLVLIPVVLVFAAPVPRTDGRALLPYIAAHKGIYLTELVCFVGLSVPALVSFAAVTAALKDVSKSIALAGGLLGVASETIASRSAAARSRCTAGSWWPRVCGSRGGVPG